jgi:hypothetical protein
MRQLGDFATWMGLILLVLGVVYYAPKLVDYINTEDVAARSGPTFVARPRASHLPRRHMAMNHAWANHREHASPR